MGRGHRDDRRRRLLSEDLTANSGLPAPDIEGASSRNGQPPARKSENYGDAEFLQTQLRLTDLIPRRLISHILLLIAGLFSIAGLIALYLWVDQSVADPLLRPAIAKLGSTGSLGSWLGSLLLLTAGFFAIIVYSVRRHKLDDFHGHYHVWLWAAACWFLMATDTAASLHACLQQLMISLTGTPIAGDGSIWWMVPTLVLLGTTGSRLLIDMRSSRLSSTALILAGIAYFVSFAAWFRGIALQSEVYQFLLIEGALLGGHLLLAISMGLHARYVILDAEGELPKRVIKKKPEKKQAEKKRAEKKAEASAGKPVANDSATDVRRDEADSSEDADESDDEESEKWVAVDPPHGNAQPVLKRVTPAASSSPLGSRVASVVSGNPASASPVDESKLSKAERKALKKKLIDERLKRERKAANW
jgi:hypothetical protein